MDTFLSQIPTPEHFFVNLHFDALKTKVYIRIMMEEKRKTETFF